MTPARCLICGGHRLDSLGRVKNLEAFGQPICVRPACLDMVGRLLGPAAASVHETQVLRPLGAKEDL